MYTISTYQLWEKGGASKPDCSSPPPPSLPCRRCMRLVKESGRRIKSVHGRADVTNPSVLDQYMCVPCGITSHRSTHTTAGVLRH